MENQGLTPLTNKIMSQGLCLAHNGIASMPDLISVLNEINFCELNEIFGPCPENATWVKGSWTQMGLSESFDCECFWYGEFSYIHVLVNRDFFNWSFPVEWKRFSSDLSIINRLVEALKILDISLKSDIFIFHSGSGNGSGERIQNCFFNDYTFRELVAEIMNPINEVNRASQP